MSDDFKPQGAFEGYIFGKLEGIEAKLKDLPCGVVLDRLNKVENKVSNIEGKATMLGAVAGLLAGLFKGAFWPK